MTMLDPSPAEPQGNCFVCFFFLTNRWIEASKDKFGFRHEIKMLDYIPRRHLKFAPRPENSLRDSSRPENVM